MSRNATSVGVSVRLRFPDTSLLYQPVCYRRTRVQLDLHVSLLLGAIAYLRCPHYHTPTSSACVCGFVIVIRSLVLMAWV